MRLTEYSENCLVRHGRCSVEMAAHGSALAQLQERDYTAKHRGRGEPVHLIGVEFSGQTRNVTAFEVADG